ncbi:MAG: hypothetical protein ABIU05_16095, partial [Nitrospirales bacterium]
ASGSALPENYPRFLELIESSDLLQRLCSSNNYALDWRHALRTQLGVMWEHNRYPLPHDDFTGQIAVLDRLIQGMIGPRDTSEASSMHWDFTAQLLQHFFSYQNPEPWHADAVRMRVENWLAKTHAVEREVTLIVETRLMALSKHEEGIGS